MLFFCFLFLQSTGFARHFPQRFVVFSARESTANYGVPFERSGREPCIHLRSSNALARLTSSRSSFSSCGSGTTRESKRERERERECLCVVEYKTHDQWSVAGTGEWRSDFKALENVWPVQLRARDAVPRSNRRVWCAFYLKRNQLLLNRFSHPWCWYSSLIEQLIMKN